MKKTEECDKINVWGEVDGHQDTEDLMNTLGLKEQVHQLAKANHALRSIDDKLLMKALQSTV